MTLIQMIARPLVALVLFCGGLWGCIEGLSHAAGAVGVLPVAFGLTIALTAIVSYALTRRFAPPPSPSPPPTP